MCKSHSIMINSKLLLINLRKYVNLAECLSKCSSYHLFFEDYFFTESFIHSNIYFFIHSPFHHFPFIHSTNVYEGPRHVHPWLGTEATELHNTDTLPDVWIARQHNQLDLAKNISQTKIYTIMLWSFQRIHF